MKNFRPIGTSKSTTSCVYCKNREDLTGYDVCPAHRMSNNVHFYHCRASSDCPLLRRYGMGAFNREDNDYLDRIYKSYRADQKERKQISNDIKEQFLDDTDRTIRERFDALFKKWDPTGKFRCNGNKVTRKRDFIQNTNDQDDDIIQEERKRTKTLVININEPRKTRSMKNNNDIICISEKTIDIKCPIMKEVMIRPYRNEMCGHVYEYDNIITLMKSYGKKNECPCPVAGCSEWVIKNMLKSAKDVLEEIKRRKTSGDREANEAIVNLDNISDETWEELMQEPDAPITNTSSYNVLMFEYTDLEEWDHDMVVEWVKKRIDLSEQDMQEV
jgi:hypothetical protein